MFLGISSRYRLFMSLTYIFWISEISSTNTNCYKKWNELWQISDFICTIKLGTFHISKFQIFRNISIFTLHIWRFEPILYSSSENLCVKYSSLFQNKTRELLSQTQKITKVPDLPETKENPLIYNSIINYKFWGRVFVKIF